MIALHEVSFRYPGGDEVLRGLSLQTETGTIAAVLGPNGCGKTTMLDICMGWKAPDSGGVLLDGLPLSQWSRRRRGMTMSLVPQRENLRFDFSVHEYVLLGRSPHLSPLALPGRADSAIVENALETVGLRRLAGRPVSALSGGEYRLMLVARSLSQEPSLLLLDEPAGHLDPANAMLIVRLLRKLRDKGVTILYTGHDPQTAAVSADTIHLMSEGRLRYSGRPREVLTEEALAEVYGVRPKIVWIGDGPHIRWDG
jgi:iron complex transport system ATP-binding protein